MNPTSNNYQPVPPPTPVLQMPPPGVNEGWRSLVSAIALMGGALVIALSIAAFVIQSYQVDGESMETALQDGDRLIVEKLPRTLARITHHPYIPHRGDIVIFNQNNIFDSKGSQEKQLIKRVIGLPGERVTVKDNQITVYNASHPAGFNPDNSGLYKITAAETPGNVDVTLSNGEIFVCGDNRPFSEDSRYFGPVEANSLVGKLVVRIFPTGKVQRF